MKSKTCKQLFSKNKSKTIIILPYCSANMSVAAARAWHPGRMKSSLNMSNEPSAARVSEIAQKVAEKVSTMAIYMAFNLSFFD